MLKKTTLPFHASESSNRVFPAGVSGTIVDPQTTGSVAKKAPLLTHQLLSLR